MSNTEGSTAEVIQVPVVKPGAIFIAPRVEGERDKPVAVAAADALVDDAAYVLDAIARNDLGSAKASAIAEADVKAVSRAVFEYRSTGKLAPDSRDGLVLGLGRIFMTIAPVTMRTLKDTDPSETYGCFWWFAGFFPTYKARWLSRKLLLATFVFMVIAVCGEVLHRRYGAPVEKAAGLVNLVNMVLQVLTPFTYGAMGACVFLLRSLHVFIYERTYDFRRESEYANRVLLGMVSGGAVMLLVEQLGGNGSSGLRFSSAALGFITGYNTDFLFSTIERITAAILPKAAPPPDTTGGGKPR